MKKHNISRLFYSFAFFFALVLILSPSCRRNKDCDLVITIEDGMTKAPVVGAEVWLYPNQTGTSGNLQIQDQKANTDAAGVAKFTFKLPAILEAKVTPPSPYLIPPNTLVKLEEGRSVSKAIKVYQ